MYAAITRNGPEPEHPTRTELASDGQRIHAGSDRAMDFYRLLTRLAGQLLLGLAAFVWAVIALLDDGREMLRAGFGAGAITALVALTALNKGWPGASIAGAGALIGPIGLLAQANGAAPWAWLFWLICAMGTERWLRDASGGHGQQEMNGH